MTNERAISDALIAIFLIAAFAFGVFVCTVVLLRWIFCINKIVDLLRKIDINTSKDQSIHLPIIEKPIPEGRCEACKKYLPKTELQIIKIGGVPKTVCPTCKKFLQP